MAKTDPPSDASRQGGASADAFERAKRHLLLACAAVGLGLAVAGSSDRTTGGVLVLIGWVAAIASLHRLGRTGSDRGVRSP